MASPKGTSCSAKSEREDPPVSQEVNPSKISAAVRSKITSVSALTPESISGLILLAPSIKGCTLAMNEDRSAPIWGNCPEIPLIKPPTIPPTKEPIATPTLSSSFPPSLISQDKPGI